MLELRLFGAGQARYFDHFLPGFPEQQPYLLLCYLLLNRHRPHHREHLAAVFWGEHTTSTSRKYLRNALWRLRGALQPLGVPVDEYLLVQGDQVAFHGSGSYWLDIEVFEAAAARFLGLPGRELTPEQAGLLEEAVDLYVGNLLEGVYEDWCLYDREQLYLLYLNTLSKLMDFHEINGTYERGLACGERILACDNTREKVHRQMMRLYWFQGNRAGALAQFKRCAQILRETLGVPPTEETRHLRQQIMSGRSRPLQPSPHRVSSQETLAPEESTRLPTEQALQQLRRLRVAVDQISIELGRLESQLRTAMANP